MDIIQIVFTSIVTIIAWETIKKYSHKKDKD